MTPGKAYQESEADSTVINLITSEIIRCRALHNQSNGISNGLFSVAVCRVFGRWCQSGVRFE